MFLVVLAFLPFVLANFECGQETINIDIHNGYEVDEEFVAPDQNCILNFTWPDEYIAYVKVNAGLLTRSDFVTLRSTWDDLTHYQEIGSDYESLNADVIWPKSGLQVKLHSNPDTVMVLSISIKLEHLPLSDVNERVKWEYDVTPGMYPTVVNTKAWLTQSAISVKATTKLALSTTIPETSKIDRMNFFMYERNDNGLKFVGTLACFDEKFIYDGNELIIYNSKDTGPASITVRDAEKAPTFFDVWWSPLNVFGKIFSHLIY